MSESNTDWCPVEEATTEYEGETCKSCGRVWGRDYPQITATP